MKTRAPEIVWDDRIVQLDGGQNFREVGGYPTTDGRHLRRGMIWRSARLDTLSARDVETIRGLGIVAIADLRRKRERERHPTCEGLGGAIGESFVFWDHDTSVDRDDQGHFRSGGSEDDHFEAMLKLYPLIAKTHELHFRELIQLMSGGRLPMLIHCTAGKDRTGVAVALLLGIAGVERDYIMADYALTETLIDWSRLDISAVAGTGVGESWYDRLDETARAMLFRSDERYLEAMFDYIERRHGTIGEYVANGLGVGEDSVNRLRDALVTD